MPTGATVIDFGAFPGAAEAAVTVIGQAGIVASSLVEAWIEPAATADHPADEHVYEELDVIASDIVAGTGFTVRGVCRATGDAMLWGRYNVAWAWL